MLIESTDFLIPYMIVNVQLSRWGVPSNHLVINIFAETNELNLDTQLHHCQSDPHTTSWLQQILLVGMWGG